jgi:hypothetical protein
LCELLGGEKNCERDSCRILTLDRIFKRKRCAICLNLSKLDSWRNENPCIKMGFAKFNILPVIVRVGNSR